MPGRCDRSPRNWQIEALDPGDTTSIAACVALLVQAFDQPERYYPERLFHELEGGSDGCYRQFFVARQDGSVIGVAGIKAADWASQTHVLYLSAVAPTHRKQGVGRALLLARIAWVEARFNSGRLLVSSHHIRRFKTHGFKVIGDQQGEEDQDGRRLMMRSFKTG